MGKLQSAIEKRILEFKEYFPSEGSLQQFESLLFDSVPVRFTYDRQARFVSLILGMELERFLGIRDYFRESIYVLYDFRVTLPPKDFRRHFCFSESFQFSNGQGLGDQLKITPITGRTKFVAEKKSGLWIPKKGFRVRLRHIDFTCFVDRLSDIQVRLCKKKGTVPEIIHTGDRTIAGPNSPHGLSFLQLARESIRESPIGYGRDK